MSKELEALVTRFFKDYKKVVSAADRAALTEYFVLDLREHLDPLTAEDEAIVWRLIAEKQRRRHQFRVHGRMEPARYTVPYSGLTSRQKREYLRLKEEGF